MKLWQADLSKTNKKAAEALADPLEYDNLFPELQLALKAEKVQSEEKLWLQWWSTWHLRISMLEHFLTSFAGSRTRA